MDFYKYLEPLWLPFLGPPRHSTPPSSGQASMRLMPVSRGRPARAVAPSQDSLTDTSSSNALAKMLEWEYRRGGR